MKQSSRKLLSLLMAFAIILSLLPGSALAAGSDVAISAPSTAKPGETISLVASASDPYDDGEHSDYDLMDYAWESNSGTLTASGYLGETASFIVPEDASGSIIVTVTASYRNGSETLLKTGQTTIRIQQPSLTAITLDTYAMELTAGGTAGRLTATLEPAGAEGTITWRSDNPSVATVSSSGVVTPVAEGTANITASSGNVTSRECAVTVKAAATAPTGIQMSSSNPTTLRAGQTYTFEAQLTPAGATGTVVWSSSNRAVAAIDAASGALTALTAGTTTITATVSGTNISDTLNLTVQPAVSADPTLSISSSTLSITSGTSRTLTATLSGVDASERPNYSILWDTSDPSIVYFHDDDIAEASGISTPFGAASATITVTLVGGTASGSATITARLLHDADILSTAICEVTNGSTTSTLPLSPSSVTVGVNQVTSTRVVPTITSWSNASYIDWTVTSGTGSAWISSTNTSGNWGLTARTTLSNGVIPGVYVNGRTAGTATLTAVLRTSAGAELARNSISITIGNSGFTLSPNPSNTSTVYLNESGSTSSSNYYRTFSATPYLGNTSILNTSGYSISYVWTLNGYTVQSYASTTTGTNRNSYQYTLYANNQYLNGNYWNTGTNRGNTLTCTAYVTTNGTTPTPTNYAFTNQVSWNVYSGYNTQFTVSATIYDSNTGYALTDTPDGTTTSIADQIDSWVRSNYYYNSSSYSRNYDVRVYGGTAYESGTSGNRGTLTTNSNFLSYSDLSKIVFTPGSTVSSSTGSYQISFNFDVRVYNYNSTSAYDTVSGTMVFTVRQGTASAGNINYSSELGKDVYFDVSDFENFWTGIYSRGSLSYVTFGSVSGGTVYNSSNKSVGTTSYYVSPRSNQSGLDGVYFSPNSTTSKSATTVRIPFTAYGTTSSTGTSTTPRTGTIVITYLSAAASTISYSANANGTVSLKAQDFIDAYKAAVKTTSNPSNLTIVFQSVPSYGTLTYTDSSKSNSSAVRLTNSNIKSRSFTTRTTGTNQIGDVTYTASGSRTETISYIGYIGTTASFTGEVTFNAATTATNVPVSFTCYTTSGIPLALSNFTLASPTAMSSAGYITFGTPRTGKLINTTGSSIGNSPILVSQLGNVTYVPAVTSTVATDSFTFSAYNVSGTLVASGTVTVTVSLPANVVKPGSITNINQLTDIPPAGPTSDWYRPQLTYLINKGVINGKGDGKFGPEDALTYGEALKMIMNAAGYYEAEADENQANVSHWAQNYKNTAVQRNWLQNSVDLRATISRDSMAELTAKVLGIAAATNQTSPFADSTNAYAIALYNNKIVQGELWDNGTRHFTPTKALTRNEMVCLVYNMYQFTGK